MRYIKEDWHGQDCPKTGFEILKKEGWLFRVAVTRPPEKSPLGKANQYQEGLWEQDVAEWFVANPASGHYLEFNLASNGAWWLMAFSSERQRAEKLLDGLDGIETHAYSQVDSWSAELKVPERVLISALGDHVWTYNVCFILGNAPRQFLSLNKLGSQEPDFHRPSEITEILK